MKTRLLTLSAVLIAAVSLTAQDHYFVAPDTQFHQMHSDLTGRDYELLITLPGSYESEPERSYPALYLTDAQWDMALLASIRDKLIYDRVLPEIILVGITYPGADADYGTLRSRDMSPTRVEERNPDSGDGPKFLQFIEEGIIPYIETTYRADPNERALGGSSFGGLFSLFAMYEKPELFKRHIAISPSVDWDKGYMFRRDNEHASGSDALAARLFISYGGGEYSKYTDTVAAFQKKLAAREYKGMALLNWTMEGERHGGVGMEGWTRGLRWVFKDIVPEGPGPLELLYQSRNDEIEIVE